MTFISKQKNVFVKNSKLTGIRWVGCSGHAVHYIRADSALQIKKQTY
jgi:hypothetical protein